MFTTIVPLIPVTPSVAGEVAKLPAVLQRPMNRTEIQLAMGKESLGDG